MDEAYEKCIRCQNCVEIDKNCVALDKRNVGKPKR